MRNIRKQRGKPADKGAWVCLDSVERLSLRPPERHVRVPVHTQHCVTTGDRPQAKYDLYEYRQV